MARSLFTFFLIVLFWSNAVLAQEGLPTLEEVKVTGASRSNYRNQNPRPVSTGSPQPNLAVFRGKVEPILRGACFQCHGPDEQEGNFRIDSLDPDLIHGGDADWWLEVIDVLSNAEMPPESEGDKLADEDRSLVIDWLSTEIQVASQVRRSEQGHSSFRRMTRYEYNYALQDLLGLPYDFAKNLPPDTASEDGFLNSSEMLQISVSQLEQYRELGFKALEKVTLRGTRPEPLFYGISMESVFQRLRKSEGNLGGGRDRSRAERDRDGAHYKDLETGETFDAAFQYRDTDWMHHPTTVKPEIPDASSHVAIIPESDAPSDYQENIRNSMQRSSIKFDLGDSLPDTGIMTVRVRASRTSAKGKSSPSLRMFFGFQATNQSGVQVRVGDRDDVAVDAIPTSPEFYEWDVHLGELPRNIYRGRTRPGRNPNPTEFLELVNIHQSAPDDPSVDIQIDYLEVSVQDYKRWPPPWHSRIFFDHEETADETAYAREVLSRFMTRAWRRPIASDELDRKLDHFSRLRPECTDFQEAIIEVLASVIASPNFLYLIQYDGAEDSQGEQPVTDFELATRLSMFLWSSVPDKELLDLARAGELSSPDVLVRQAERLLADPRAQRFAKHFVRQWLGLHRLDNLEVDQNAHSHFDSYLREAMQEEPIAFFRQVLKENRSVMDFIHSDYVTVNERLARHYAIPEVYGHKFRKVALRPEDRRGGLLTQAGLLAMNSDGKDSHPLMRGIWMLESILNDPPPPPPPAVPIIDLADPEILKMTLKERIENHRSNPACFSCHSKIDPWGIAFENFDATGSWRSEVNGQPVDAISLLFNKQELRGMDGMKRFLLENRQDQFARAMAHKLSAYALGRPLGFADRSSVDSITADFRRQGDGLATLITSIVTSDLFQTK